MVYLLDSATGKLEVLYDLPRDSAGDIVLPLSKGKAFLLAVDTVPPVVTDVTPPVAREAGAAPVISGTVADNVKNCRAVLRYRKGGEETYDSVSVSIGPDGHFEVPLSLQLDGNGFEYSLAANDGRNRQATPRADIPVAVKALRSDDSLPALQWRLFALPTLPDRFAWDTVMAPLGRYGQDWRLFERTATGLSEFGAGLGEARAGTAYWLKSRKRAFQPTLKSGVAAPVNKPFELALPPRSWRSFGNPYLFPVAWQSVLDSTPGSDAVKGPYTFRDSAWVAPIEIAALTPWEGYYCYNASDDTVRLRIPSLKAKNPQPAVSAAAFGLRWDVRGNEGKDGGNWFGALPAAKTGAAAKASAAADGPRWRSPKPETPEGSLRAGFVADGEAGLLQTDFRAWDAEGGAAWSARLSGLKAGRTYENRFAGLEALPPGMAAGVADPATGSFRMLQAGGTYAVEAQPGEETRTLRVYAGTRDYVESQGRAFAEAHPFALELGAYPNPVRTFTLIRFTVPANAAGRSPVRVSVFDMKGRMVIRLTEGKLPMGRHQLRWDARDAGGGKVPAGAYRLRLEAGARTLTRPLQVLP
jgi:hypothetical protein